MQLVVEQADEQAGGVEQAEGRQGDVEQAEGRRTGRREDRG